MADEIEPFEGKSKGLIQDVRPGGVEVTGQQRELFPFDAFKYSSGLTGADDVITLEDGWSLDGGALEPDSVTSDSIDVESLFAEDIELTGSITSSNYVEGEAGFKIDGPTGSIDIVDGMFSGTLDAVDGTFKGTLDAASGTFSGSILVTDGDRSIEMTSAKMLFTNDNVFGGTTEGSIFKNSGGGLTLRSINGIGGAVILYDASTGKSLGWSGNYLRANLDDSADLGASSNRWKTVYATTGTINTSDKRYKKEITTSDLGLDFVRNVEPVSYRLTEGESNRAHYGFIAQQVKNVLDDIKKDSKDFAGYVETTSIDEETGKVSEQFGLRYSEFIAPLWKAVQELDTKVEELIRLIEGVQ